MELYLTGINKYYFKKLERMSNNNKHLEYEKEKDLHVSTGWGNIVFENWVDEKNNEPLIKRLNCEAFISIYQLGYYEGQDNK